MRVKLRSEQSLLDLCLIDFFPSVESLESTRNLLRSSHDSFLVIKEPSAYTGYNGVQSS